MRRAAGVMPDGTPFDIPADSPLPDPIDVPESAAGQIVWLSMPIGAAQHARSRRQARPKAQAAIIVGAETFIDSTSALRIEEEIDIAFPRLELRTAQDRQARLRRARHRARSWKSATRTIMFDEKYVPPMLVCSAHPVVDGWIDRIDRLDRQQARGACRATPPIPTSGGGLQSVDYFVLQLLNRHIPVLKHFSGSGYVHPERLFEELLRLAGELATFATPERRARDYPAYDQDDLENVFAPLMRDIQEFLSARLGRRAIRLEIIERAQNAFVSPIRDRSLFRNATFVLEVAARRPLIEIQNQFPHLFKVGPNTKMNEIVHAHLPGVPLVHLPTPPPQIRAITDHVYFYLDRKSPLWPEFSAAGSIGMHFSGDWPELELELWAVLEDRR